MSREEQIAPVGGCKEETYQALRKEILAVLKNEDNTIARMATVVSLLHQGFGDFLWTGFYLVDENRPEELIIGPYQGRLGCLRIAFGKGVCGTAAESEVVQIVDDVHQFPGHIACDARSNSEIVVPVKSKSGRLIGVLDIDSEQRGAFNETDAQELQRIMDEVFAN